MTDIAKKLLFLTAKHKPYAIEIMTKLQNSEQGAKKMMCEVHHACQFFHSALRYPLSIKAMIVGIYLTCDNHRIQVNSKLVSADNDSFIDKWFYLLQI